MSVSNNVKVSVSFITYNHERYVEQALMSAVAQEASFNYEVVVGEDCSTDNTRHIVARIASQYPAVVRMLPREKNIGAYENAQDTARQCRGVYRAPLEGDDYWTDKHKLQKQVDYMEKHPECVLCFTDALEVFEGTSRSARVSKPPARKIYYDLDDILEGCFIPTCTVLTRNGLLTEYPAWFTTLKQCDWSEFVLVSKYGRFGYIPETMAARRVHISGAWSGMSKECELRSMIESYKHFDLYLNGKHRRMIGMLVDRLRFKLAIECEKQGRLAESVKLLKECCGTLLTNRYLSKWVLVKLLVKYCIPRGRLKAQHQKKTLWQE
jgi:glycosyltransferase involved in cell wall biosynthesis